MKMDITELSHFEIESLVDRLGKMGLKTKIKRLGEKLTLIADTQKIRYFDSPVDVEFISF